MKLTTEVSFPQYPFTINHSSKIFLMGSCFANEIGAKFQYFAYPSLLNPFGTVYNPASISKQIKYLTRVCNISENQLIEQNGQFLFLDGNTIFQTRNPGQLISEIRKVIEQGNSFLSNCDFAVITLGSSYVYELKQNKEIVANCHKLPADLFSRRSLDLSEIILYLREIVENLTQLSRNLNIIFTVSPVRHIKDGLVENNRSKARLLLAVEKITESFSHCYYFPSYEIVLDELRDYRFYANDLNHVNSLGVNYVWKKVEEQLIDISSLKIHNQVDQFRKLQNHLVVGGKEAELAHEQKIIEKRDKLTEKYPHLKLENETII